MALQLYSKKEKCMKREFKWSNAMSWTCAAILAGIAAAYTPAFGNGSTWTLPYSGSTSTTGVALAVTNTNTNGGNAILASGFTGIQSTGTGSNGYGVYGA